jgi:hypothetical protein
MSRVCRVCYGWINPALDISFFLFIFFANKVQLRKFLMVTIYLCACKVNDSITRWWGKMNTTSRCWSSMFRWDIYKYKVTLQISTFNILLFMPRLVTPLLMTISERFRVLVNIVQTKWGISNWLKRIFEEASSNCIHQLLKGWK